MNLVEFLQNLSIKGVKFLCDGENLRIGDSQEVLTPDIIAQVKQHKTEILKLLREQPDILEVYPLSYGQKAMWFLWQLAPNSGAYNISVAIQISDPVDVKVWHQVCQKFRERHPILGSIFPKLDIEPIQKVNHNQELDFLEINTSTWSQDELQERLLKEHYHPFALDTDSVMRVRYFTRSEGEQILLLTIHHIAWDGRSIDLSMTELSKLYQAQTSGLKASLPLIQSTYRDYVRWQKEMVDSTQGEKLWSYWQQKLAGELPVLNLPTDKPRPPIQTFRGSAQYWHLPEELNQQLRNLAKKENVTLYMVLLAAFQILLYRYTGQEDILVGSVTSGRSQAEFASIVGYFVNPVVLRANLSGDETFQEFLTQVRHTVLEALEHQDYPFALLVERLQPQRDPSRSPIFQVAFALLQFQQSSENSKFLLNQRQSSVNWGGIEVTPLTMPNQEGLFDLDLEIIEDGSSLVARLKYCTHLFAASTITRMLGHFQTLLEGIVTNPEQKLGQLPLMTEVELEQLLVEWNNTKTDYPKDKCIHQLFEEQVEKNPDAVAVVFEEQKLTYSQLNSKANQLAHYLQKLGVAPETLVGICVERSVEMVVGLLAILKAGGAYVPLDPNYPTSRLNYMIEDAKLSVVITKQKLLIILPETIASVICLDTYEEIISQQSQQNLENEITANQSAYLIYTSGSTGQPKGVTILHQGVVRLVCNTNYVQLKPTDRLAQVSSTSFDAATFEIWGGLLHGAMVVIITKSLLLSPQEFVNYIKQEKITTLFLTTALFNQLAYSVPEAFSTLKNLLFGGEAVDPKSVKQVVEKGAPERLLHVYGPTENTTFSSWYKVNQVAEGATNLPIGKPISNTKIYILDSQLQPVPIGVVGELHVRGDGLARGYHKRAELTAEKFISNPFENKSKLYKTGDLARYLPDGNIEFIGRIDHQVKVRGYRIETGEIEATINQHTQVKETVVLARKDNSGNKGLVAYIVLESETLEGSDTEQIEQIGKVKQYLKDRLPEYMIPSRFILLPQLPLTPNGKVDRNVLPVPDGELVSSQEFVPPQTKTQKTLAEIWQEVLGIKQVGIHDNFFEIGGDSIISIQIVARAQKVGIQLTTKQLLQNQTIARQAMVAGVMEIVQHQQGLVTGEIPLTPIQHWFFEQNQPQMHHFNQSMLLSVSPQIDQELLSRAVGKILEHHDALRLRFHKKSDYWEQINVGRSENIPFEVADLSKLLETEQL
ncbi:amino acid adenylation domain-containing protein, partial [Moorena sp. SIO3B2]|uniref:non-ribosomal peptide synthetase n=1 Tax=Moorena sp. SIO3B2 TaxID=2607827 RepID=UPI0013CC7225